MDPKAALDSFRRAFDAAIEHEDNSEHHTDRQGQLASDAYREAATYAADLFEWLQNGGFPPNWA